MKYFIIHNGSQVGPIEKKQLINYGLTPNSHIWHEGLDNWIKASEDPNLSSMLSITPPPIIPPEIPIGTNDRVFEYIEIESAIVKSFFDNIPGRLCINPESFSFKPNALGHILSLKKVPNSHFNIKDICGYKKNRAAFITIFMNNGSKLKLSISLKESEKDNIINQLEDRRKAFFTTRNLPIPPLTQTV